jgi:signal transduction histidine kinase
LGTAKFGRKIGSGFAATVLLAILITVVSIYALRSVISTNDLVSFNHAQDLFDVEQLRTVAQQKVAIARGFLLTHDGLFVADSRMADTELRTILARLDKRATSPEDVKALTRLRKFEHAHELGLQHAYALGKSRRFGQQKVSRYFNNEVMPKFDAWEHELAIYSKMKQRQVDAARQEAREAASRAMHLILVIAFGALVLAVTLAFILTRTLTKLYGEVAIAVRAREDVLAIVSHDLKNPLSSMLLSSALILRTPETLTAPQTQLMRTIHFSGQQMKKLIEDLLDFVLVEFGKMKVTKKLEDPNALLDEVLSVFAPLAHEKDIRLKKSVAKEISSIECDRGRIVQVLSNLLGNAIKFTPVRGTISLNITAVDQETLFWVRDSGPGVPSEQLPRVFDRYWQGEQKERQSVGLGLAIAKGLVEAHGGRIWAESQPGEGSTFFFTLPNPGFKTESEPLLSVEGLRTVLKRLPRKGSVSVGASFEASDDDQEPELN